MSGFLQTVTIKVPSVSFAGSLPSTCWHLSKPNRTNMTHNPKTTILLSFQKTEIKNKENIRIANKMDSEKSKKEAKKIPPTKEIHKNCSNLEAVI